MADIKISQLSAMSVVNDANVMPIVANDVTMKVSAQKMKEYTIGTTDNTDLGASVSAQIKTLADNLDRLDTFGELKGKTIAVFGSSNDVDGYNDGHSWVYYMTQMLNGYATVVNKSVGGKNVKQSISDFIADTDKANYDYVLFTSVRNLFHAQIIDDIVKTLDNPNENPGYLITAIRSLNSYKTINQTIMFASCLPEANSFRGIPMAVYDGIVKKECVNNGFKMLDMHSWLGISNEETTPYLVDSLHYKDEVMPILAIKCIKALIKGNEPYENYKCSMYGESIFNYSGFTFNSDLDYVDIGADDVFSVDVNLEPLLYLHLQNKSGSTLVAGTHIVDFNPTSGTGVQRWFCRPAYNFAPSLLSNCNGAALEYRERPFSIEALSDIVSEQTFLITIGNFRSILDM